MKKILIVDDSVLQATQLKSILKDEYDITIAQKGEEGLRLAGGFLADPAGCGDAGDGRLYVAEEAPGR